MPVKMETKPGLSSSSRLFSFFSSDTEKVTASTEWNGLFPTGYVHHLFQEKQKSHSNPSKPVWWLDICDATEKEIEMVSQALSIHPLTAEDIATRDPREKVEVFKNYYFISFQTLASRCTDDEHRTGIPPSADLYILVFQCGVVTFSPSGCGHVNRVQDRIRRIHEPSILSSGWICYALIDDVIDSFETFPRAAEQESEAIEDQVFIARIDDVKTLILQVDILRKKITHITRCLHGKVDILNDFIKRSQAPDKHPIFPDGDIALYLGDVQDHLVTTLSTLSHIDEVISHCQTTCLAQLSATNFRVSLTINSVISKVTVLAAIFVPLHLVTSIFGMNVRVPGQNTPGLSWFFGIVGCFAAFMVICIGIAVRFKLL